MKNESEAGPKEFMEKDLSQGTNTDNVTGGGKGGRKRGRKAADKTAAKTEKELMLERGVENTKLKDKEELDTTKNTAAAGINFSRPPQGPHDAHYRSFM